MFKWFEKFRKSERGQGLVEYGLILALISIVSIGSLGDIGDSLNKTFDTVTDSVGSESIFNPDGSGDLIVDQGGSGDTIIGDGESNNGSGDTIIGEGDSNTGSGDTVVDGDSNTGSGDSIVDGTDKDGTGNDGTGGTGGTDTENPPIDVENPPTNGGNDNRYPNGYIPIATADELYSIREGVSQTFGRGTKWEGLYESGLDKNYILVANIDMSSISDYNMMRNVGGSRFTGVFDGDGHTISNLKAVENNRQYRDNVALLGRTENATIKNVGMVNVNLRVGQGEDVGALVGEAINTTITNCYSTGTVQGGVSVGGLVGSLDKNSRLTNSYSSATVGHGVGANGVQVGGLVGLVNSGSSISNSHATGSVRGNNYVGGLVGGLLSSSATDVYARGQVTHTGPGSGSFTGRLIGTTIGSTVNGVRYTTPTAVN